MLEELKGKFVKITYEDENKVKAIYGYLMEFDDNFITIRFRNGKIVVLNKLKIIRISTVDEKDK